MTERERLGLIEYYHDKLNNNRWYINKTKDLYLADLSDKEESYKLFTGSKYQYNIPTYIEENFIIRDITYKIHLQHTNENECFIENTITKKQYIVGYRTAFNLIKFYMDYIEGIDIIRTLENK